MGDGTRVDEFDLNAGNNWSHIFNGLPRCTAGHEIEYTVKEDPNCSLHHFLFWFFTEQGATNTIEGKVSVPARSDWSTSLIA